jgi:hypothetical protein
MMRTIAKALMTALAAAALLAAATSTAVAARLEVSNQGIRAEWVELILASSSAGGNPSLTCELTLEGTFHSKTFRKVSGALIGYITRAITNEHACEGSGTIPDAAASILEETLPWHILYRGFTSSLPNIPIIKLTLSQIALEVYNLPLGARCLYRGPVQGEFVREAAGAGRLRADETFGIPRVEGSVLCPNPGFFGGTSNFVTLLGRGSSITIRLI